MACALPIDCVLAVTYKCNSRCTMCDIWKIRDFPEIGIAEFLKLPKTLKDINLSGGETFLRPDLPEIVEAVSQACPQARIVISTNGFATALIVKTMKKILKIKPDIGVAVSIDGIGPVHDKIRGIPGGFNKAITTVKELQALGMDNLRLGFTVTERNVNQLAKVYDLTRELGVEFTHSFAQSSEFYFGGKQNIDFREVAEEGLTQGMVLGHETDNPPLLKLLRQQYKHIIGQELKTWNIKRWLRAYYSFLMLKFIASKRQPLSNTPGRDFFFMDPNGEVYPSVVHNYKMGNIRKVDNFKKFWCSPKVAAVRQKVKKAKMPVWMICTARTAIRRHPIRVAWWIISRKIKFKI